MSLIGLSVRRRELDDRNLDVRCATLPSCGVLIRTGPFKSRVEYDSKVTDKERNPALRS
jgi:hypothetical protein